MRARLTVPLLLLAVLVGGTLVASKLLDRFAASPPDASEGRDESSDRDATTRPAADVDGAAPRRSAETTGATANGPAEPIDAPAPPLPLFPIERRRGDLVVETVDDVGRPVEACALELASSPGGFEPSLEVGDDRALALTATSGPDGSATFPRIPAGCFRLRARARDGREVSERRVFRAAAGDPRSAPWRVVLARGAAHADLVVLVVGGDGKPVSDALVQLFGAGESLDAGTDRVETKHERRTGEDGRARFRDLAVDDGLVLAKARDGRVGTSDTRQAELELVDKEPVETCRVVVEPGATLEGELVGVDAAQLAGSTLHVDLRTSQQPYYWSWGTSVAAPVVGTRFRVESLPRADDASVRLDSPRGVRLVAPPIDFGGALENSAHPPTVALEPGRTTHVELAVALGATIRGRVTTSDGSPVVGALVRETFAPRTTNFPDGFVLRGVNVWRFDSDSRRASDHPFTHATARTNARGEYALAGLQPGRHRVEVSAPRLSFDRREGVAVADGATVELDHVLVPAGVLQGVAPLSTYLGVTRVEGGVLAATPIAIAVLGADHSFTFAGLPPGEYALSAFHSDSTVEPVELARATVEAGRTTWVDLTDARGPFVLAGRVVDSKGPVEGALVEFFPTTRRTDADGLFEFTLPFDLLGSANVNVTVGRVVHRFTVAKERSRGGRWDEELALDGERLDVVALDARGAPIGGTLRMSNEGIAASPEPPQFRSLAIALDASGHATIDHLPAGELVIDAELANGSRLHQSVTLPRDAPLELRAARCGTVDVVVRDESRRPLRRLHVAVGTYLREGEIPDDVRGHDEWFEWTGAATDVGGRALVHGVRTGALLVRIVDTRDWSGVTRVPPFETRLDLHEGETRPLDVVVSASSR
jgi:protocatechuate 3,4-dioxygenase beta subunit